MEWCGPCWMDSGWLTLVGIIYIYIYIYIVNTFKLRPKPDRVTGDGNGQLDGPRGGPAETDR